MLIKHHKYSENIKQGCHSVNMVPRLCKKHSCGRLMRQKRLFSLNKLAAISIKML